MDKCSMKKFVNFTKSLKGDEKGEAQLFCDHLFRAFGHGGIIEANGLLEARIKFSDIGKTKFADCVWSPKGRKGVLIEMKKRGEKHLANHFIQVRDYWINMNPEALFGEGSQKPEYIILCNFDTFLIYRQLSFVDEIKLEELPDRYIALNFLLTEEKERLYEKEKAGEPIQSPGLPGFVKEVSGFMSEDCVAL